MRNGGTGGAAGGLTRRLPRILSATAILAVPACGAGGPQSALEPDGPAARAVLELGWALLALAAAVVLLVNGLLLYALLRRRELDGTPPTTPLARSVTESDRQSASPVESVAADQIGSGMDGAFTGVTLDTAREDVASVRWVLRGGLFFPLLTLTPLFVFTLWTLARVAAPDDAPVLVIEVTGRQFWWEVRYLDDRGTPLFETANEIHIPVGLPVEVRLRSTDVIHSFWVPRLAPKIDNIPGRTTVLRIQADRADTYRGQCAEYCGVQHAHMSFLVIAEPEGQFRAWMDAEREPAAEPADSLAEAGRAVFLQAACVGCHSVRGTPAAGDVGPDLTHLASRRTLAAGLLPNTFGHLGGWITDPQALKPGSLMPAVPLEPRDLNALMRYLGSLR